MFKLSLLLYALPYAASLSAPQDAAQLAVLLCVSCLAWSLCWVYRQDFPPLALVAVSLIGVLASLAATPAFENDFYRYYLDGWQIRNGMNPYQTPLSQLPQTALSESEWKLVGFPELPTIYGPVAELLFFLLQSLSLDSVENFRRLLGVTNWLALAISFLWITRQERRNDFLLLLSHPLILHECVRNAHFDGIFASVLLLTLGSRAWFAMAFNIKFVGLLALPLSFSRPANHRTSQTLLAIAALILPWLFFFDGAPQLLQTLSLFHNEWEMNSGTFRWLRQLIGLQGAFWATYLLFACSFAIVAKSKMVLGEKKFWVFLFLVLFAPVVNPWYLTWSLVFLPFTRDSATSFIYISIPAYYVFHSEIYEQWGEFIWNIEHLFIWAAIGYVIVKRQLAKNASSS